MQTIRETNFNFKGQEAFYRGKVRDVYIFPHRMLMIASDRISAFDTILPQAIPFKGQVLNQLSAFFMEASQTQVPSWVRALPDPNVSIGLRCEPIPIEMVIRAYLAGSAWRAYRDGQRIFNGYTLPEGLQENDPLPEPIITPSTKAEKGAHDEEISTQEILKQKIVSPQVYEQLEAYTRTLFQIGSDIAKEKKLILADTKYEFGTRNGDVYLIDEIHTPDSSRYFDLEGFAERQAKQERQPHRSKEMVRQWLIEKGFQGFVGQAIPEMSETWIQAISQEYINLYEQITGNDFLKAPSEDRMEQMEIRINQALLAKY